jgi:hypothetical protein
MVDALIGLLGPVAAVTALSWRRALEIPIDDTTAMLLRFAGGAAGTLVTSPATAQNWRIQSGQRYGLRGETQLVVTRAGAKPGCGIRPDRQGAGRSECFAASWLAAVILSPTPTRSTASLCWSRSSLGAPALGARRLRPPAHGAAAMPAVAPDMDGLLFDTETLYREAATATAALGP